jgi:hypothetical protein
VLEALYVRFVWAVFQPSLFTTAGCEREIKLSRGVMPVGCRGVPTGVSHLELNRASVQDLRL